MEFLWKMQRSSLMQSYTSSKSKKIVGLIIIFFITTVGCVSLALSSAEYQKVAQKNKVATPHADSVIDENTEKAELKVDGMSCSGCIFNIKAALEGIEGIKDIYVNVAAGKAEIIYDKTKLQSLERVETAITQSGYPSKTIRVWTAEQIQQESDRSKDKAGLYIAAIGNYDILRDDFLTELGHAKTRYIKIYGSGVFTSEQGPDLLKNLKVQIVSRLINHGIQMQEIQKVGFRINPEVMAQEFENFLKERNLTQSQFEKELSQNGYSLEYFKKKYASRVLVKKYLDDTILVGTTTDSEKRQRYTEWFNNARLLAEVVYYDKDLERLIQTQRAGASCSGGSCSRSSK